MRAMVLNNLGRLENNGAPLVLLDLPVPTPKPHELLIKISVCAVCHTELDEIEGRTPPPKLPMVPGHQVVGIVEATGAAVTRFEVGERVGVAWIYSACGNCSYCEAGNENLCDQFVATGRDANGGYAEYMTVAEDFAFAIPDCFSDSQAAPLLCAGAIGYRSLKLTQLKDGDSLGLTGFGASAHLVLKMVKYLFPNSDVYVFARKPEEQAFALGLGACWAGGIEDYSPQKLTAIIDTTPAWKPVIEALKNLQPGGRLVINAIRKEEGDRSYLFQLDYFNHLWYEKEIKSVANVARSDVREFLHLAETIPIYPRVEKFTLKDANQALIELKYQKVKGAKVLMVNR